MINLFKRDEHHYYIQYNMLLCEHILIDSIRCEDNEFISGIMDCLTAFTRPLNTHNALYKERLYI